MNGAIWRGMALALGLATACMAAAQDAYRPVIVVNDMAITAFELDQRILLLSAFGTGGDVTALAREQLIDDRLRMSTARRLEVELSDEQLEEGWRIFATSRNLTPEQVRGALTARGIATETMDDFLAGQLLWRSVVQALFRARATPTEADLDAALEYANRAVQESVLLQEIAIPFADRGEDASMDLARRLSRELNRGGNFAAAARRHSRAASARNGGRLDWVPARGLPPQVAGQVLALQPGEVTAPIAIPGGVAVIKLLDVREDPRDPERDDQALTYSQLIVPLALGAPAAAEAAARAQLEEIRQEAEFCTDLDNRADEFGVGSGRSDPTPAGAVPDGLGATLDLLDPGDKEIIRDSRGVVLVMLCGRAGEVSPEDREALRVRLFNQRMNAFAQGYLQELRGDAIIENR